MANVNKVIIVGNLGRDSSCYYPERHVMMVSGSGVSRTPLSISNDMPESGGGEVSTGVTDGPDVAASDDDDGGDSDGEPARRSPLKHPSPSGKHRNVTATAGALSVLQNPDIALWRLPTVLAHVPVSKSEWWHGVKTGRYPAGIKLGLRITAWRSSDIRSLIASF